MSRRFPKLSPQDASVVDLVCNHSTNGVTKLGAIPSQPRLAAATKLLNLLDLLADEDPPTNLTTRTMQYISNAAQPIRHPNPPTEAASARIH